MKNYIEEFDKDFDDLYAKNAVGFTNQFTSKRYEEIKDFITEAIQSAKKEAVEECIKKIDDYGDKLVREGAEEQSDYYMGELNAVSRIKELIERKQTL